MNWSTFAGRWWLPASPFRSLGKRAFYGAGLLLPGTLIVLPLLWWLDRRASRGLGKACAESNHALKRHWLVRSSGIHAHTRRLRRVVGEFRNGFRPRSKRNDQLAQTE